MPKNTKTSSTVTVPNRAQPAEVPLRDQAAEPTRAAQTPGVQDQAHDQTHGEVASRPRQTKAALVRQMLLDPQGATLASLIAATGWQAHTVRAALSGLRKAGLTITRLTGDEGSLYRAVLAPDAAPPTAPATTTIRNDASVAARRPARRRNTRAQDVARDHGTTTVGTDDGRANAEATSSVQS